MACASPKINSDTKLATAGYFQLRWHDESDGSFQLQQASNLDFADAVTIYQGPDQATVVSGLPDGDYFYRIRGNGQAWSEPLKVSVQHHSLAKAFAFFGLGAGMFVAMLAVLLKGVRCKEG
ncbi:hypothetical protein [Methylomonas sp. MgM2]